MMDKLNPLKTMVEQRQSNGGLPDPVPVGPKVSGRSVQKMERRASAELEKKTKLDARKAAKNQLKKERQALRLEKKNAKEAKATKARVDKERQAQRDAQAGVAAKESADEAKSAKMPVDKERQDDSMVSTNMVHETRDDARQQASFVAKTPAITVNYMYDFTNEPVPKTKKELKALILKLSDVNKELHARLLENSLSEPARAAGTLMAAATQVVDNLLSQADLEHDRKVKETAIMLKSTLEDVCTELTATVMQAANVAVDTVKNLKVR